MRVHEKTLTYSRDRPRIDGLRENAGTDLHDHHHGDEQLRRAEHHNEHDATASAAAHDGHRAGAGTEQFSERHRNPAFGAGATASHVDQDQ
jgi:hypothetical protein